MSLKIAVFGSGNGGNFQAIQDHITKGTLNAEIKLLVCDKSDAYIIERAKKENIPYFVVSYTKDKSREEIDKTILDAVQEADVDVLVLAGYMRLLSSVVIKVFHNRILNIHPSLLPAFPGVHGIHDAQTWGVKFTGCTVHFVDEMMDNGSIIIQACIPVVDGESLETLQQRIHEQEHRIYPQALQWMADNRLELCESSRMVKVKGDNHRGLAPLSYGVLINPPLEEGF